MSGRMMMRGRKTMRETASSTSERHDIGGDEGTTRGGKGGRGAGRRSRRKRMMLRMLPSSPSPSPSRGPRLLGDSKQIVVTSGVRGPPEELRRPPETSGGGSARGEGGGEPFQVHKPL